MANDGESFFRPGQGNHGEQCPFCHYETEPGTCVCRGCGAKRQVYANIFLRIIFRLLYVVAPIIIIAGALIFSGTRSEPKIILSLLVVIIAVIGITLAFVCPKKVVWER